MNHPMDGGNLNNPPYTKGLKSNDQFLNTGLEMRDTPPSPSPPFSSSMPPAT